MDAPQRKSQKHGRQKHAAHQPPGKQHSLERAHRARHWCLRNQWPPKPMAGIVPVASNTCYLKARPTARLPRLVFVSRSKKKTVLIVRMLLLSINFHHFFSWHKKENKDLDFVHLRFFLRRNVPTLKVSLSSCPSLFRSFHLGLSLPLFLLFVLSQALTFFVAFVVFCLLWQLRSKSKRCKYLVGESK